MRKRIQGLSAVLVWTVLAVFLAQGCGKDTLVAYEEDGIEDAQLDSVVFKDMSQDVGDPNGGEKDLYIDPDEDSELRYEIILLHDTSITTQLLVGEHFSVQAKVIDYQENGPAAFYPVRFRVIDSSPLCDTTPPCAQFLAGEGTTDENGRVSVTLSAGEQGNQSYVLELDGAKAEPVMMDVQVNDLPTGDLRVRFNYEGEVAIHSLNVRVTQGFNSCTQFSAVAPWNNDIVGQNTVTGVDSMVNFGPLQIAPTYQVFATALGPTNHLTAAGCVDAVHVLPDEQGTTEVTLNLYILALNPAGTYDTVNHFDFTGAIPGQAGEIVNLIVNIFYDPGAVIIDLVKELVSQYIGSWVTDLAFGLFEDALADLVTNWLLDVPFLEDFFTIGQDLVQIVKNLEMTSQLKISKLGSDYSIQGLQNWLGITLYWKLGCPKEGEPGYDPACGAHPFSLLDLQNTDFPMDLISGQFTGMIANYDYLIIDTHKIEINYGKLILFVINKMLLPAISDYDSLTDLLYSLIDCHAVATGFVGDILDAIGIDSSTVEGFCNQAEAFLLGPIESIIGGLAIDSRLRVHGKCRMLDENDDLIVDKLFDGEWFGHIEIGAEEGEEFEGDFTAEKATYPGY